ncbi:hypothetical protein DE4585_04237 [Mycobacteroides salmoniphilum]|uniref:Uncharacterized protein n=1 Tax=Mycobacteroides salmoniphilum TaxID=404941 RepID=A0A4R8S0U1_9MYCO|nr:hypothetical protein [Mycobacteroides salmoniphilum]TDZ78400.1 hypothetical protein DE4585_04237 [Mycobacteroides salmoniphilum]
MTSPIEPPDESKYQRELGRIIGRYTGGVRTARVYATEFIRWRSTEIDAGSALSDLLAVRDLFTDIDDYCPDYIPEPWDPMWISETEMRQRLMNDRIPALEDLFGEDFIEAHSPDADYLAKCEELARRVDIALVSYSTGRIDGDIFVADIYAIQDDGDRWQVFHELLDTAYSDAAALEMGSPDIGSDSYGRDARLLAAQRAQTLESAFGLTAD